MNETQFERLCSINKMLIKRRPEMKRKTVTMLSMLLVCFTSAVSFAADTIKIGALYPMSGRGGLYGQDSEAVIKIAPGVCRS